MRVISTISGRITAAAMLVGAVQSGCSSTRAADSAKAAAERDTTIVHEACTTDSASAEKLDANGDGRPDVVMVRDGGRELCRAIDLNFDGVPDTYVYFEGDGSVRRRENDYDRDGRVDEISIFKSGVLQQKQRATMLSNKVDTWEFYAAGKLARSERDSNGDSIIDQWWEYPTAGCPVIHADVNNDGRPDPGASVDYCKETGYVPPERQDYRKTESPNFQQSGSLPTELDSKEAPAAGDAKPAAAPAPASPAKAGGQ
jgi:hypothetical protein